MSLKSARIALVAVCLVTAATIGTPAAAAHPRDQHERGSHVSGNQQQDSQPGKRRIKPARTTNYSDIAARPLYVDTTTQAAQWVSANSGDPLAARIDTWIASVPTARWFLRDTDAQWTSAYVQGAANLGHVPVLIAYYLPGRDCGSYSGGGAPDDASYLEWIRTFAAGIGTTKTVVVLEPDSLYYVDCLDAAGIAHRAALLQRALDILIATAPGALIYLDGGSAWYTTTADQMAERLAAAGVHRTRGFATNISNFFDNPAATAFAMNISHTLAERHGVPGMKFVIDSSRNGNGSDGNWCNPAGRALGGPPAWTPNRTDGLDGFLWIKRPGESDGSCGTAPDSKSGDFVPALADALISGAGR